MALIRCEARLFEPDAKSIATAPMLVLPKEASAQLPSRGMVLVHGSCNGEPFSAVLEPDGQGSHWCKAPAAVLERAAVTLEFEPGKDWPEPTVPADLQSALEADSAARSTWADITPMARWDWIRWVGATKNPKTRSRRVEVTCSKLRSGQRRACCFDRSQCTVTEA
jgi:hypothetical protein